MGAVDAQNTLVSCVIGILLFSPTLSAKPQASDADASTSRPQESSVSGKIVNAVSGAPISNATVTLKPRSSTGSLDALLARLGPRNGADPQRALDADYAATSDANGVFAISNVKPGAYYLYAERAGYLRGAWRSERPNNVFGPLLTVATGQNTQELVIRLFPYSAVNGRVFDENAEPVYQATVQALQRRWRLGRSELEMVGMTTTNDRGEYRISGLAPGTYYIFVLPPHPLDATGNDPDKKKGTTLGRTFYPGVLTQDAATPLVVQPAADITGMDVPVKRTRTFSVSGKIDKGRTENGYSGYLVPETAFGLPAPLAGGQLRFDDSGSFKTDGIQPGSYVIRVTDAKGMIAAQHVEVTDSDVDGLSLAFPDVVTVRGRVTVAGKQDADLSGVFLRLSPEDPTLAGRALRTRVAKDGDFQFQGVIAGTYFFVASELPDGSYLAGLTLGRQTVRDFTVQVSANSTLAVTLATDGGTVSGSVHKSGDSDAGKPALPPSTVVLIRDPMLPHGAGTIYLSPGEDGRYSVSAVPPGDYMVFAVQEMNNALWTIPEFVGRVRSQGKALHVDSGGSSSVELTLIEAADLQGLAAQYL